MSLNIKLLKYFLLNLDSKSYHNIDNKITYTNIRNIYGFLINGNIKSLNITFVQNQYAIFLLIIVSSFIPVDIYIGDFNIKCDLKITSSKEIEKLLSYQSKDKISTKNISYGKIHYMYKKRIADLEKDLATSLQTTNTYKHRALQAEKVLKSSSRINASISPTIY